LWICLIDRRSSLLSIFSERCCCWRIENEGG
jgi:hypothetical protein